MKENLVKFERIMNVEIGLRKLEIDGKRKQDGPVTFSADWQLAIGIGSAVIGSNLVAG